MPHVNHPDGVDRHVVPVQGEVTRRSVRDDELAQMTSNPAANPRMHSQNVDGRADRRYGALRPVRGRFEKELDDALQIRERATGIDYARHRTALGRRALRPPALAARNSWTASAS